MPVTALRTLDENFADLPDWPYDARYIDDLEGFDSLRMHYIDEGPRDAERTFLCLHGQPTWAYLYRKMIPVFLASGARVIAPDFFGFGRSDKPVEDAVYTYHFHRNAMLAFIARVAPEDVTLVVQDWGGLIGLTLPMEMPARFARLLIMNTSIAVGESPGKGFDDWRAYSNSRPDMDVAALMARATPVLSDAEAAAYGAPFPDAAHKAGVRRFPQLVMTDPGMEGIETSKRAKAFWSDDWQGESFMAIGEADPVLGKPVMEALRGVIRGCPAPMLIPDAGHFVQEWGEDVARAALAHWGDV